MKLCKCGCGKEVTKKYNRFIYNHHNRGQRHPNFGKKWCSMKGEDNPRYREDITKEKILQTISEIINNNGRIFYKRQLWVLICEKLKCSRTLIRKICGDMKNILNELHIELIMPKKEFSDEYRKKISDAHKGDKNYNFRYDITKDSVHKSVENIINKFGNRIGKRELLQLLYENLNCSSSPVKRLFGTIDKLLKESNIEVSKKRYWKKKENLGIEVSKEVFGDGEIKKYYRGIGYPDYVPNNQSRPIIDIKSTTADCSIEQQEKYERIRKDVRFMVFEDKGKTKVNNDKILYMKQIIRTLPDDKKLIFTEKYEKVKNNIPLEQRTLKEVMNEKNETKS